MRSMLIELFGEYTPVMFEQVHYIQTADGGYIKVMSDVVASGLAGVDWPWVAGVFLFAIVLYSLFRLLGVFFK